MIPLTFEKILNDLSFNVIDTKKAYEEVSQKEKMKRINYYAHIENISKEPLKDGQLQELNAIVGILQILYNSSIGSPVSDSTYDILQEMLIDLGIPRLSGSIEINGTSKLEHTYRNLRGTLDKVYYLFPDEKRTNRSRKSLDEWIKSAENLYEKNTGKRINLNDVKVILQGKYDGASCVLEIGNNKMTWLTRGHTGTNKASDVSHIMNIFNNLYSEYSDSGIKFEVMVTEENKDRINELYRNREYKNSRQIVTATLNSNEADFKADYLYPVPLRVMKKGDEVERIHPDHIRKFPTKICKFSDRDIIKDFANNNKWVIVNGMRFRTDGVVITILDDEIQKALGRDKDINQFEVAYKFTEEKAVTKIKNVKFETSMFGFITPVAVFNDVVLKGNTINHASLSNKERFDELDLHYGDEINVLYDIIPYVTKDINNRNPRGRRIEFVKNCPACGSELDLDVVQVQCNNRNCRSRIVGRILNYCNNLRIQNIGYSTLEDLHLAGLLKKGIRSLYKLKKKTFEMEEIEGFGRLKTRKIVSEIESRRRLKDWELLGSIGIESLSMKTFQSIFSKIKYSDFIDMIFNKSFDVLYSKLVVIGGMGEIRSKLLIRYFKDGEYRNELLKLAEELSIQETYGEDSTSKGRIVFSGCRPSEKELKQLQDWSWEPSESLTKSSKYLVIPDANYESSKVVKAREYGIKIIPAGTNLIRTLKLAIPNLIK